MVKHSSVRILLRLVTQYNLDLVKLDVKTTFLLRELEEDIYAIIKWIQGIIDGRVCRLTKSLYVLK